MVVAEVENCLSDYRVGRRCLSDYGVGRRFVILRFQHHLLGIHLRNLHQSMNHQIVESIRLFSTSFILDFKISFSDSNDVTLLFSASQCLSIKSWADFSTSFSSLVENSSTKLLKTSLITGVISTVRCAIIAAITFSSLSKSNSSSIFCALFAIMTINSTSILTGRDHNKKSTNLRFLCTIK